jgi:hypothetical protein
VRNDPGCVYLHKATDDHDSDVVALIDVFLSEQGAIVMKVTAGAGALFVRWFDRFISTEDRRFAARLRDPNKFA